MNKKVLKTMIALVVIFLIACYVLKIFFPEQFVMVIENKTLIQIGDFIDKRMWLSKIVSGISTFLSMWLYLCAVMRKWVLNWKEILALLIVVIISRILFLYDVDIANALVSLSMFIIPMFGNTKLKDVTTVYSIHYISQLLSLKIRNLPLLITHINSIIAITLSIESYFWLLLFYIYFNYKKEN